MTVPVSDLQAVAPSAIIELFVLELNVLQHGAADTYRFHAGTSLNANGELVWAGNAYMRFPVEAEGFEYSGNGQLPRPKIRVSNILGTITAILVALPNGLEGAKLTRIRTLARYLDAVNFPSRRNLLTTSSDFSGLWSKGASLANFFTVTTSSIPAPTGSLNAARFESTATTSQGLFLRAVQPQSAATYHISVYIYVPSQAGVTNWGLLFDAQDSADQASIPTQTLFDQWVRVSATLTYTATRTFLDFNIRRNGGAPSAAGFVFHAWGAQLEIGTSTTDYQEIEAVWSQNPYGTPDPTAALPAEVFYIDRKTTENRDVVEFELASAFDLAGVRVPKRQCISNICQWKYRSTECSYAPVASFSGVYSRTTNSLTVVAASHGLVAGQQVYLSFTTGAAVSGTYTVVTAIAGSFTVTTAASGVTSGNVTATQWYDENDQPIYVLANDVCGKRLSSCKARFGQNAELPYGGYPGIGTYFT